MAPVQAERSAAWHRWVLAAIIGLAFFLRVYGIRFGLPLLSNFYIRPDESLIVVSAVDFFANGGNPGYFVYPALMIVLSAVAFQINASVASLIGSAPSDLRLDFGADPSTYFLLVRWLSATAGVAATAVVYAIGRSFSGPAVGLLAAMLYATAPLAVRDAHFGVTDSVLAFWSAMVMLQLGRYLDGSAASCRRLVYVTVCLGLAVSTKYPALVLLPIAAASILFGPGGSITQRILAAAGVLAGAAAVFALLNPYLMSDFVSQVAEIRLLLAAIFQDRQASGSWQEVIAGIVEPLRQGPGLLLGLLLCGAGLAAPAASGTHVRKRILLAAAAGAFLLPLLLTDVRPYRYAVPTLPFLSVLAAEGIFAVAGLLRRRRELAVTLLAAACTLPAAWRSYQLDVRLARDDTRSLAGRWIEAHVPPEVPVVIIAPPECEPQLAESATAIERRIDYVKRRYGAGAGERIASLYRLQLEAHNRDGGHEVFRNDSGVAGSRVCLVTASYPLPNPACPPGWGNMLVQAYSGNVLSAAAFEGVTPGARGAAIDAIDAFFLPFTHLGHVPRPGPNIMVQVVERAHGRTPPRSLAPPAVPAPGTSR